MIISLQHSSERNEHRGADDVVVVCQVQTRKYNVGSWKEKEFHGLHTLQKLVSESDLK